MRKSLACALSILSLTLLSQCGDDATPPSDYVTVSGVSHEIGPGSAKAFPALQYVELEPSDRFPARHILLDGGERPGVTMRVTVRLGTDEGDPMLWVFSPDGAPDDIHVFAPPGFHFPDAWLYEPAGAAGEFQAELPARSGTFSVQRLRQTASFDVPPEFVGETTCDEACDDKLCCGSGKCWLARISICYTEGRHPAPCWACLCEMAWGCLSHDNDACKRSCDTCNQNTWKGTDHHCTYHL